MPVFNMNNTLSVVDKELRTLRLISYPIYSTHMPITFEGLNEGKLSEVHVTDGRKTYFYDEKKKSSSWYLPPDDIEKLVRAFLLTFMI